MPILETGESFQIEVTQASLAAADAAHWCALRVRAFQVDAAGQPLGIEMPAFTHTIALAALADGSTTIAGMLELVAQKASDQFRNFLAARRALADIPVSAHG